MYAIRYTLQLCGEDRSSARVQDEAQRAAQRRRRPPRSRARDSQRQASRGARSHPRELGARRDRRGPLRFSDARRHRSRPRRPCAWRHGHARRSPRRAPRPSSRPLTRGQVVLARSARQQLLGLDWPLIDAVEDASGLVERDPYIGHALRGRLHGLLSPRVGAYRIIYQLSHDAPDSPRGGDSASLDRLSHGPMMMLASAKNAHWFGGRSRDVGPTSPGTASRMASVGARLRSAGARAGYGVPIVVDGKVVLLVPRCAVVVLVELAGAGSAGQAAL